MFASMMRAVGAVLVLCTAGCVCPTGQSCQPTSGSTPDDPAGPGGIRTGVVEIERNGTVIGYMSQDPDPTRAHWNWWLLGSTASMPLELLPIQSLKMTPVDSTGTRLTGAELCARYAGTLTTPKLYKEVSSVSAPTVCE